MSLLSSSEPPAKARDEVAESVGDGSRTTGRSAGWFQRRCRRLLLQRLSGLSGGQLEIVDHNGRWQLGRPNDDALKSSLFVHDPQFYVAAVMGGGLGAAESYLRGAWTSDDLVATMRTLARHGEDLSALERGTARLVEPLRALWNLRYRNTLTGSQRNIAAHYDLSNEFFSIMLDPTMTYSCGLFDSPSNTLEEASLAKYDRICQKLQLTPTDHVVEIGCGWGGFAEFAASRYGCRVTAITISRPQFDFANERMRRAGLDDRVCVRLEDYRNLRGTFDKLVSIEMIEAVGERYLDAYFGCCSRLLAPHGLMALQAITIPDHRYDRYRRSVDFIQQYIFPGGFLPSVAAIGQALRRATDFRLLHLEDFGAHYATTLARWRSNFWAELPAIRELGFDDRFLRMWDYYLCYCQAGFSERQIGVSQWILSKPQNRRGPILRVMIEHDADVSTV